MAKQPAPTGAEVPLPVLRHFRSDDFRQRLDEMIDKTQEYDGTLPVAWQQAEAGKLEGRERVGADEVDTITAGHIRRLVTSVRNAGIRSMAIEAGHAYMYDSMEDPQLRASLETQYRHANVLGRLLTENRIAVKRLLFVDDYNLRPEPGNDSSTLDLDDYVAYARQHSFHPDYLVMEQDMAPVAAAMVQYMHRCQGLILEQQGSEPRKLLKRRKVELVKQANTMSCASLDAALTVLKLRYLADGVVNILPKHQGVEGFSFKGQQRKVRQILAEHLHLRVLPFFNIFTSDHPDIEHTSGAHHSFRKEK